jgi:hypothetical protein
MNGQELHLLVNHVPVIGSMGALLLLAIAWLWPSKALVRTALAFTVLVGVSAVAAFLTGEPAEEVIEHLPGIVSGAIEHHEEMADRALWLGIATGLVGLVGLFMGRRGSGKRSLVLPSLVFMIALVALMTWTAHLGGKIHRPELSGAGAVVAPGGGEARGDDD